MNTNWIKNQNGSIYHLGLLKDQLANTILTVGDQKRVPIVSRYFDLIEFKNTNREFICHTGYIGAKRLSVLSTGIGTDNTDIVVNECDALFNINPKNEEPISNPTRLDFIRIGTSGAIQEDISIDSILISKAAIGTDSLMNFYYNEFSDQSLNLLKLFQKEGINLTSLYYSEADGELFKQFSTSDFNTGISITAPGFYAPQGRITRIPSAIEMLLVKYSKLKLQNQKISNIEMETAGIYALAKSLKHRAISLNAILANRITGEFSSDPEKTIKKLIEATLEQILKN